MLGLKPSEASEHSKSLPATPWSPRLPPCGPLNSWSLRVGLRAPTWLDTGLRLDMCRCSPGSGHAGAADMQEPLLGLSWTQGRPHHTPRLLLTPAPTTTSVGTPGSPKSTANLLPPSGDCLAKRQNVTLRVPLSDPYGVLCWPHPGLRLCGGMWAFI